MNIIGVYGIPDDGSQYSKNGNTHDHGLCSIEESTGKICVTELERYTGVKHDNRLPEYISELLEIHNNGEFEIASVNSFLGNSFHSTDRRFSFNGKRFEIKDIIDESECLFDGVSIKAHQVCHEFAHIASCLPFTGNFEDNSMLLHIDGGASASASSVWMWEDEKPKLLHASWDDLKTIVNNFNTSPIAQAILGLENTDHLSMPGKLMGYASYGTYNEKIRIWLESNEWFFFYDNKQDMLREINSFFGSSISRFDTHEKIMMDIVATIQQSFEDDVLRYISTFKEKTGAEHLYYAGGAALNIPTNSRILKECGFKTIFVPPCTGDSGLCIGAASWIKYLQDGPLKIHTPFLGKKTDYKEEKKTIEKIVPKLVSGGVLGLFIEGSEVGPRALGHRSIIARPDSVELRKYVSEELKKREWYRPLAPVMISDVAKLVLEEEIIPRDLSNYMLGSYNVKKEYEDKFAGVVHSDGTVRAQVIWPNDGNEPLYSILKALYENYGITGLIQTSFNKKGEPMVNSIDKATEVGNEMDIEVIWG